MQLLVKYCMIKCCQKFHTSTLLPMILVRNQIRDMIVGEIGKITFRRMKYKFRTSSNKNSSLCTIHVYWYNWRVRTSRLGIRLILN